MKLAITLVLLPVLSFAIHTQKEIELFQKLAPFENQTGTVTHKFDKQVFISNSNCEVVVRKKSNTIQIVGSPYSPHVKTKYVYKHTTSTSGSDFKTKTYRRKQYLCPSQLNNDGRRFRQKISIGKDQVKIESSWRCGFFGKRHVDEVICDYSL